MVQKLPETVIEGSIYKNERTDERVVAWHVDANRVVRFSPETGNTGREERMREVEFLERFTRVDEKQPKATVNNADGTEKK